VPTLDRTAWRALVIEAANTAGKAAAAAAASLARSKSISAAKKAWRKAAGDFHRFRFHDLRQQAIAEMAEKGATDATLMALAGHMSRRMMEHYSHVRTAAKREITSQLESGLMGDRPEPREPGSKGVN
jgi:integrase